MSDVLFELIVNISDRFHLSPFFIQKQSFHDVFEMVRYFNKLDSTKTKRGNRRIRRKAGDNWF